MVRLTFILAIVVSLVVTATRTPTSSAAKRCGYDGYSYAGVKAATPEAGVGAEITALSEPHVTTGHVAARVGVGGAGLGPKGSSEWLQAGISAAAGQPATLYYQVALP
jgi:hypothetical protein